MRRSGRRWQAAGRRVIPGVMARLRASVDLRLGIAALYVFGAMLVGLAHQVTPANAGLSAALRTLSPAELADMCLSPDSQPGSSHGSSLCDACLITAAPGVVASAPALAAPLGILLSDALRRDGERPVAVPRPQSLPRGPPAPSMLV